MLRFNYWLTRFGEWLFCSTFGGWVLCLLGFLVMLWVCLGTASGLIVFYEDVWQPWNR